MIMAYITVGKENSTNIDLYYEDHGAGKPIVLIHGYPLSGRAWEKQVPVLLNAGYRVITYDRRGFGGSSQPTSGYNYDIFAQDLHALITTLKLEKVTLVGHSMGGGEVVRYMGTYGTQNITKAVVISGVPPYLRKAADNPDGVDAAVFADITKKVIADRPAYLSDFCNQFYNVDLLGGNLVSDQVVEASWLISVAASPHAAIACVDTWGTDFRNDVAKINIPTLIIHGDSDRIVPFINSGKILATKIAGSTLVVIPQGPHGICWTHADKVNSALLDFLKK
jgi:non-heme chloroperoxidase